MGVGRSLGLMVLEGGLAKDQGIIHGDWVFIHLGLTGMIPNPRRSFRKDPICPSGVA